MSCRGLAGLRKPGDTGSWHHRRIPHPNYRGKVAPVLGTQDCGGGAVVAGPGNYCTAESIELTKEAERMGVDVALLVVPYYNKPTQEGLYQHFKAIASNTSLPCILYNVPGRTGSNLAAETVIKLSQVDNIVGIKEASGNFDQIGRIIA